LVWQPSGRTLIAAAVLDFLLFVWTLAMLGAYWIWVAAKNCTSATNNDTPPKGFYVFIETVCTNDPGMTSMRSACETFDQFQQSKASLPPNGEVYHWHAIQACVALCIVFAFCGFWILIAGTRASAREIGRCTFDKRKCQECMIGFCTIILIFSIGTVASLYDSDSYDAQKWITDIKATTGWQCDVTVGPGPAIGFAILSLIFSVIILGTLACPGCHCFGFHEPGRCCEKCVDQDADKDGTSEL
jgi:hypothetical protein